MSDIIKKPLIQIAQEVADLEKALIESGGLISEEIEQRLAIKDLELPVKVDGYASILKRLDVTADHFRAQADFFVQVAKGIDQAHSRLKENLKNAMEIMATNEIKGHNYRLKMSKSKPVVIIEDESKLDGKYLVTIPATTRPDKNLIARDLDSGATVTGARLEGQASLRIFANKGE